MSHWTDSAREELERHLEKVRALLERSGADPSEVVEDLRRHVDEEIKSAKLEVVTQDNVIQILSRLSPASSLEEKKIDGSSASGSPEGRVVPRLSAGLLTSGSIIVFGILLPAITLAVEMATHMCAETFFDPLPTVWHILFVALVPVSNLATVMGPSKGTNWFGRLGFLNALALGVSLFYTLLFLPLMPLSAVAIVIYGMGFLSLAPFLGFLATWGARRHLKRASKQETSKPLRLGWGLMLSLGLLFAIELPSTVTRFALQQAAAESPGIRLRGIRWLRAIGNDEVVLRACYQRSGLATDIVGFVLGLADPVTPTQAREIYYRVTGVPFNAVPPPRLTGRGRWNPGDEFDFDLGQGGREVAGRLRGLSLASSRVDGSTDGDAALAYLEWTMVFKNISPRQQEARAQIALPPGGVVSRLTLWIDGEEREAAFAARSRVREAYEAVVRARRDPVLITTTGPNRILLQCFPVPPDGGEMKLRFGITVPLVLDTREKGTLRLPYFHERNFHIAEEVSHSIWVESKKPLESIHPGLGKEHPNEDLYAVRGSVSDAELLGAVKVTISRSPETVEVWCEDPLDKKGVVIRQILSEEKLERPARLVWVLDGSRSMAESLRSIAELMPTLPEGLEFGVLVASDEVVDVSGGIRKVSPDACESVAKALREIKADGGCDNLPALLRAWDLTAQTSSSLILWVHGPQPFLFQKGEELRQRWERRPGNPILFDLQVAGGSNRLSEELDGVYEVRGLPGAGESVEELDAFFTSLKGTGGRPVFRRDRVNAEAYLHKEKAKKTSSHLARLWAFDEVMNLLTTGQKVDEAVRLATQYQLVTPVSGAVVLETREQFTQAGLEPAKPGTVPTIPEPELWLLLVVAAIGLLWAAFRTRTRPAAA